MSSRSDVCFSPVFVCPHCHALWSHGYGKGEPKGKATCPRCAPALSDGYEAGYEAGYDRCHDELSPGVLATEDAYLDGYSDGLDTGWLAAMRADIERHAVRCEQDAAAKDVYAAECRAQEALEAARGDSYKGTAALFGINAERAEAAASRLRFQQADCRRWLEATS